jgi:hypothetical protein
MRFMNFAKNMRTVEEFTYSGWIENTQPKWEAQQVCSEYGLLTGTMIKVVSEDQRVTGM